AASPLDAPGGRSHADLVTALQKVRELIFCGKGAGSSFGGQPSPVLPDGRIVSSCTADHRPQLGCPPERSARSHSWLARASPRALAISWPMVRPHPGWSGLGRASAATSRRATSLCALTVLVCSLRSSAAAFSRFFLARLRKRPMARL